VLVQRTLFGYDAPSIDGAFTTVKRTELSQGAWVEYAPEWVSGQAALFDALSGGTTWRTIQEKLYDKIVDAPRLVATLPEDGPGHQVLEVARRALSERYGVEFERVSLALYRDGKDSVAWHGDRVARTMEATFVATISLGGPRRMLLRPRGGGPSTRFDVGLGDLIVMGGTCQRTWQHSIPKATRAEPRIAVMFRPRWE